MSNRLFEYYREELRFLYDQGKVFSKTHGDEASLLDVERDPQEDPFVRRLVEAFAFLTARVQLKLDDDFPKIASAMLEKLLPLSTRPFPAFTVVQLEAGDQLKPGGQFLPRIESRLTLEQYSNTYFRTCYDSTCQAIDLTGCRLNRVFKEARHAAAKPAVSALKISMQGSDGLPLNSALNDTLRFFVSDRDIQHELAELIFNPMSRLGIGFQTKNQQWELPTDQLRILGFESDELILPPFDGLPMEYQLLMELFAYPAKHLFFEIPVPAGLQASTENSFDLYVYFKTSDERLEAIVDNESLALNCVPIVNLFQPQPIARTISTYCVDSLIDANAGEMDLEIFDLGEVHGVDEDGKIVGISPFYSVHHYGATTEGSLFYSAKREFRNQGDGTDVSVSLVDLKLEPAEGNKFNQILVRPLCCNRIFRDLNLVSLDSSSFKVNAAGLVNSARRVGDWSRMIIPRTDSRYFWQLISLLNLNYLLLNDSRKVATLRRMLELLDRPSTSLNKSWIGSVARVTTDRVTDRIEGAPWGAIADGTQIEVSLDETRQSNRPGSWFVFSIGLNYFFSLHAGLNSFTQLTVLAAEDGRVLSSFPKRCGTRKLI